MTTSLHRAAKAAVPSPLRALARGMFGWRWFEGHFGSWAEARAACAGYDDAAIVERVLTATQAVREGRAEFERDGVQFQVAEPEPGLMAAFGRIAAEPPVAGRAVDFGGALGTTFWRHRAALGGLGFATWDVVEQPGFVTAGRAHLAESPVRFFPTVAEAQAAVRHEVLLASTSLQYLEDPGATLEAWMAEGFPWIVLNNLPLHTKGPDRIAVQRVPPEIYPASYPVWFFNREVFFARFNGRYEVALEYAAEAVWQVGWRRYASTGLLLRRRDMR